MSAASDLIRKRILELRALKSSPTSPVDEKKNEVEEPKWNFGTPIEEKKEEEIFEPLIQLHPLQQSAVDLALEGKSFCLCGSAGTGKTFTTKTVIRQLLNSGSIPNFQFSTEYLSSENPSIVITAFTKRAIRNIQKAIDNPAIACVNFHKLLEYAPVYYDVQNELTGEWSKTMRFEPRYNRGNKLPQPSIIIVEESSQFSVEMFSLLSAAIPNPKEVQWIFIGDIQQLPPVGGSSIYGPKLIELDGVELTHVYRQALESPIIQFLTDIRDGKQIARNNWKNYTKKEDGETPNNLMRIGSFPQNLDWEEALYQATGFLKQDYEKGIYNPYEDMVLVPMNIKFGTEKINKIIAEFLDDKENRIVHPIVVGWNKLYLAIGDHVLYDTLDYKVVGIEENPSYKGTLPPPPSSSIDRDGLQKVGKDETPDWEPDSKSSKEDINIDEVDDLDLFVRKSLEKEQEEKFNAASHIITLQSLDSDLGLETKISQVGDLAKMTLSYAMTIHKSQGLQSERVYLFLHSSHKRMCNREMLYTGASRAQKYITIITEPSVLSESIKRQRIKGETLEQKKAFFKDKLADLFNEETEE